MKIALLVVLDDPLVLDVVLEAQLVERVGHQGEAVAEDVDVDVGALADVAGQDAADQPRPEACQHAHEPQGIEPHVAQVSPAAWDPRASGPSPGSGRGSPCCSAGRRAGGDTRRQAGVAALRLAVKYSVSVR